MAIATDLAGAETILGVTSVGAWDAVIAATVAEHGRTDGLVYNAGNTGAQALADLDLDFAEFRRMTAVDVEGSLVGIQEVGARMHEAAGGTATFHAFDVTSEVDWAAPAELTVRDHGRVDSLVNSAGDFFSKSLPDTSLDELRALWTLDAPVAAAG